MVELRTLMERCGLDLLCGDPGVEVVDVEDDTRRVKGGVGGTLFVVRQAEAGEGEVKARVMEAVGAVGAGVVAVVLPRGGVLEGLLPVLRDGGVAVLAPVGGSTRGASSPRVGGVDGVVVDQGLVGRLAGVVWGEPWARLGMIGITGTNGKTTTAYLVRHLLGEAGVRCGLIGTVAVDDGGPEGDRPATLTTPGAAEVVRLLATMVRNKVEACAMEVSSHALHQGRVAAVRFDVGVFTNLTGDHLDYHGSMEAYADAKAGLFQQIKPGGTAVVNADDAWGERMIAGLPEGVRVVRTRVVKAGSGMDASLLEEMVEARVVESGSTGTRVVLQGAGFSGEIEMVLPLVGRHNVSNAVQALGAVGGVARGNPGEQAPRASAVVKALETLPAAPGRLERVEASAAPVDALPTVLVDYAHTHDALENVLRAVRPTVAEGGRLVLVFGCGGDRDRSKRPRMGRVAVELADEVWVTSDNPRTEDPAAILAEVMAGMGDALDAWDRGGGPRVVADRATAIRLAVLGAMPADTVLIAGKGHEDYQEISDGRGGKRRVAFDDRVHARDALRGRVGTA